MSGASDHEILFAGDASTPDQGREKEQGKKRIGESFAHKPYLKGTSTR